jgi:prolyl-tRNA editing enzyme YbaK/EbsC (Cys-tRNA(Pro) deacylase)
LPVFLDISLRSFDSVYPAAGSRNSSVQIAPDRLFELVGTRWVDACRLPEASGA